MSKFNYETLEESLRIGKKVQVCCVNQFGGVEEWNNVSEIDKDFDISRYRIVEETMSKCRAIVENGRIQFLVQKGDEKYEDFAKVLKKMDGKKIISWYGDVRDENGNEMSGLVITTKGTDR